MTEHGAVVAWVPAVGVALVDPKSAYSIPPSLLEEKKIVVE
jgi:hypothetical protein